MSEAIASSRRAGDRPPRLLVIRGNSGAGKSTVAKHLRDTIREREHGRKVAIVEQDYFRRYVLKEKEQEGSDNIELILQTTAFALDRGYDVILEGIFYSPRYRSMLRKLTARCPDSHVFYMDVSLAETLRRHETKPNSAEFGEPEMREWYRERDLTGFDGEVVLPEHLPLADAVATVLERSGYGR